MGNKFKFFVINKSEKLLGWTVPSVLRFLALSRIVFKKKNKTLCTNKMANVFCSFHNKRTTCQWTLQKTCVPCKHWTIRWSETHFSAGPEKLNYVTSISPTLSKFVKVCTGCMKSTAARRRIIASLLVGQFLDLNNETVSKSSIFRKSVWEL